MFSDLSVADPALHICYRLWRFWFDVIRCSCAYLAGVPESQLPVFRFTKIDINPSLPDLHRMGASLLDAIMVIIKAEQNVSDEKTALVTWLRHVQVCVRWLLGLVTSRTRLAWRWHNIDLRMADHQRPHDSQHPMTPSVLLPEPPGLNINARALLYQAVELTQDHTPRTIKSPIVAMRLNEATLSRMAVGPLITLGTVVTHAFPYCSFFIPLTSCRLLILGHWQL